MTGASRSVPRRELSMHMVEAFLAAADATGDPALGRARRAHRRAPDPRGRRRPRLAPARALHARLGAAARIQRRRTRTTRSGPTARRSGTGWSGRGCCCTSRPRSAMPRRHGCCTDAIALFEAAVRRGWASTAPTGSSTRIALGRQTGGTRPGCTGWSPRRSPPPRSSASAPATGIRRVVPHVLGLRRALPDRRRARRLAPRTRSDQPSRRPRPGSASPMSTTLTRRRSFRRCRCGRALRGR